MRAHNLSTTVSNSKHDKGRISKNTPEAHIHKKFKHKEVQKYDKMRNKSIMHIKKSIQTYTYTSTTNWTY